VAGTSELSKGPSGYIRSIIRGSGNGCRLKAGKVTVKFIWGRNF
jgi:hypothetical protein